MKTSLGPVAKAIGAFLTSLAAWGGTALLDGVVSPVEWFGLVGVVAVTYSVWRLPNTPVPPPPSTGSFL